MIFDFVGYLRKHYMFSQKEFGPGPRTAGIIDHVKKELVEITADPDDLVEWIDLATLALDGAMRSGHAPETIAQALVDKLEANSRRTWPDWRTCSADRAIEHEREGQK
jgi:hypothetical protein